MNEPPTERIINQNPGSSYEESDKGKKTLNSRVKQLRAIFSPDKFVVSEQAKSAFKDIKVIQPAKQRLRCARMSDFKTAVSTIVKVTKGKHPTCGLDLRDQNSQQTADFEFSTESVEQTQTPQFNEESFFTPPVTPARRKRKLKSPSPSPKASKSQPTLINYINTTRAESASNDDMNCQAENNKMETEHNEGSTNQYKMKEQKVEALDLQTVMGMFRRLEEKMNSFENRRDSVVPENNQQDNSKVSALENKLTKCQDELEMLKRKCFLMKCANKMAFGAIDELSKKVNNLELNNNKKTVAIHGLYLKSEKKEAMGREIEYFICNEVGVEVNVDDFYLIGTYLPQICIVSFATLQDKREVMRNKHNLKGIVNRDNRPIFINEYWSNEANEKKKNELRLNQDNDKLTSDDQFQTEYQGQNLLLDGHPWEDYKKVRTPSSLAIIDMSQQQLDEVLEIYLSQGKVFEEKNSRYSAYMVHADSHQFIQNAYLKVKLLHPAATHVMCSYILKNPKELFDKDYCDDGDFGAGRAMLQYMEDKNLSGVACFVVRYYGGQKLGPTRFDMLRTALDSAMLEHSTQTLPAKTSEPKSQNDPAAAKFITIPVTPPPSNSSLGPRRMQNSARGKGSKPYFPSMSNQRENLRGPYSNKRRGRASYSGAVRSSTGYRGSGPNARNYRGRRGNGRGPYKNTPPPRVYDPADHPSYRSGDNQNFDSHYQSEDNRNNMETWTGGSQTGESVNE